VALTEGSGGPSAVTARTGGDDGYVDRIDDLREAVRELASTTGSSTRDDAYCRQLLLGERMRCCASKALSAAQAAVGPLLVAWVCIDVGWGCGADSPCVADRLERSDEQ
jgi:hypothetical protein